MTSWRDHWIRYWDLTLGREQVGHARETAPADRQQPGELLPRQPRGRHAQGLLDGRRAAGDDAGRALPLGLRARLEAGFGVDLSSVRIQQDGAVALALDADAVATGDRIILSPAAAEDDRLLGHEAAHIAQAASRGSVGVLGSPASPAEREARSAAHEVDAGRPAPLLGAGPAPPALARQQRTGGAAPAISPAVRREAVRIMLFLKYQEQGGTGAFTKTPAVERELERLLPDAGVIVMQAIWIPAPSGPVEAFRRLDRAGLLPLSGAEPIPSPEVEPEAAPATPVVVPKLVPVKPEEEVLEKEARISPVSLGMVGLHLRLKPMVPPPIAAAIRRQLAGRGIPVSHHQIETILAGRAQGIATLDRIVRQLAPDIPEAKRTDLAATIADALLDASLQGSLEREQPTAAERAEQRSDALKTGLGPVPSLLGRIPIGVSLTIYF